MHIKKLVLQNFNGIESFDSEFTGGIYFLTGDNEVGKSTVLNAIGTLLDGERSEVLKNGEEKGFAKMVIGDDSKEYEVDLSFTKKNPRGTLTIKSDDGMRSNNVSMLQKIFGYTDFDAVEFSRWSETAEGRRKQIAVVKSLLSEEIQTRINEIDTEVKATKEKRKEINADVKSFSAIVNSSKEGLENGDVEKYAEKIEIEDLMKKQSENAQLIEKAKNVRSALFQRIEQLNEIPSRIEKRTIDHDNYLQDLKTFSEDSQKEYDDTIKAAKEKLKNKQLDHDSKLKKARENFEIDLETIQNEKVDFSTKKKNAEEWLKKYDENNPEENSISDELKKAQEHNDKYLKVVDYHIKSKQLKSAEKEAEKHDASIKNLLEERENIISTSSLPIEGLTFTEDGLELSGVSFVSGKVSDSQIMEIAMKLTVAVNKNVKVFRIARGESLGAERLMEIINFAKANGFQGFLENVVRGQKDLQVEEYQEKQI
jgi:DNA repair exonuclease SbcCD ATPase subunit